MARFELATSSFFWRSGLWYSSRLPRRRYTGLSYKGVNRFFPLCHYYIRCFSLRATYDRYARLTMSQAPKSFGGLCHRLRKTKSQSLLANALVFEVASVIIRNESGIFITELSFFQLFRKFKFSLMPDCSLNTNSHSSSPFALATDGWRR